MLLLSFDVRYVIFDLIFDLVFDLIFERCLQSTARCKKVDIITNNNSGWNEIIFLLVGGGGV